MLFHYFGPDLLFLVIIQNGTEIHITKMFICNFKLTWLGCNLDVRKVISILEHLARRK